MRGVMETFQNKSRPKQTQHVKRGQRGQHVKRYEAPKDPRVARQQGNISNNVLHTTSPTYQTDGGTPGRKINGIKQQMLTTNIHEEPMTTSTPHHVNKVFKMYRMCETHTHTHTHTHARTHAPTHAPTQARTHASTHGRTHERKIQQDHAHTRGRPA